MLKSIKITNFYSIGEEQELSLKINAKDVLDDSAYEHESGEYLNAVACVVGPNASGKTNLLKALSFLVWFVKNSHASFQLENEIPIEPHQLSNKKPVSLEIEFYEKEVLYRYYIKLDSNRVLKEKLDRKNKRINKVPIFELTRNQKSTVIKTSPSLEINKNDEERIKSRHNISFLSGLIDLGYLSDISFFNKVKTNVNKEGYARSRHYPELFNISKILFENNPLRKKILSLSKEIDLGISDFYFQEVVSENEEGKAQVLECVHTTEKSSFNLPIFEESNGTQRSYVILTKILPILQTGGVFIADEIEDGLHPDVIKKIISLFENKSTNPHNAQLIFATHQHLLLNDRTKTQIFIAVKQEGSLETEIYRLDDVDGVRNDENYFHKYMTGIYGGTPNIKWI